MVQPVDCFQENRRMVPLLKVVKAAIVDTYGDLNSSQQRFLHWAGRSFKLHNREVLKMGGKKTLLTVNRSTMTATLPTDFEYETFIGVIDSNGRKIPLRLNSNLADNCSIDDSSFEDKCTSCGQDKTICEDLQVSEDTEVVVIDDVAYENTVIKRLYPNGDYMLETTTHIKSLENDTVSPFTEKQFITNFGLKPCGCLETTTGNIELLRTHAFGTFCNYFQACSCDSCDDSGYRIFEDTGLIQFDFNFPFTKIALEYTGFLPKKNGQFMVPEAAFETLVEHIKWRAIKDRKGIERWRIRDSWDDYVKARKMMMKILTRVSLNSIIDASRHTPVFNVDYGCDWYAFFNCPTLDQLTSGASGGSIGGSTGGSTGGDIIINRTGIASYVLAVKTGLGTGHPVQGSSTYQNNVLINATENKWIFLAKQTLTRIDGDYSFNATTGTVDISPNIFFDGDSLIIPYNKTS